MVDIRLISIIPQQPVAGVQQPQVTTGGAANPTISTFPPGTLLSGFIINRDAGGNPILRTESGDIAFESNFFLKIGSEVEIRVQNTGGNNIARILTINGQPPEQAATQSAFSQEQVILPPSLGGAPAQTSTTQSSAASSFATSAAAPTLTITGTLLTGAPETAHAPSPAPAGTQVSLKVITLQVATAPEVASVLTSQTAAATAPAPKNLNSALYSIYAKWTGNAPQIPAAPTATAPTQTPTAPLAEAIETAPTATQPATQAASASQTAKTSPLESLIANAQPTATQNTFTPPPHVAPQTGQRIEALVVGHETSGEALIETEVGLLRLPASTALTTGSKLTLEITDIALPNALPTTAAASAAPAITQLAQSWGSLQSIFTLLSGTDSLADFDFSKFLMPSLKTNDAQQPLPQQALPLASGLLAFVSSLRNGDFRSWLGKGNAAWLEENGHGALLDKASGEFSALARQFTAPAPGGWQTLFFPIAVDGQLQQVRMFTKRDRKKDSEGNPKPEDDTRFVIEMELSQLGEMQMDGFVRRKPENMQFDLVIRSLTPLPKDMQRDIQDIYLSTAELTGYKGSVSFQFVKNFPVLPMEDVAKQHMSDVMA